MPKRKRTLNVVQAYKRSRTMQLLSKQKRKPKRPFTSKQVKALKEVVKQAGGTFTDSRLQIPLTSTMTAYPGVGATSFFKLAAGDGDDTREGDSISAQSLTIRGTLQSRSNFDTNVRLMLIQYINASGASITEVLDHASPVAPYTDPNLVINSFRKLHPEIKYRVLASKTITIKAGQATTPSSVRQFLMSHKFSKSESSMNYDSATAVGPKTNSVWFYACYAQQSSSHVAPSLEYQVRGKFIR